MQGLILEKFDALFALKKQGRIVMNSSHYGELQYKGDGLFWNGFYFVSSEEKKVINQSRDTDSRVSSG